MNPGASLARMPANVFVNDLAIVMAGLANEVEAVNQYAAPIPGRSIASLIREVARFPGTFRGEVSIVIGSDIRMGNQQEHA
jgi:hypothetical protein